MERNDRPASADTGRRWAPRRRIICPKCGTAIYLSGGTAPFIPKKPSSLEEVKALFSANELGLLEIGENPDAFTVKPKVYLGRKIFKAISDVVRLAGGHYFSAGKAGRFVIPKEQQRNSLGA